MGFGEVGGHHYSGHQVAGMERTLLEPLGCIGSASHAIHETVGLVVGSSRPASRHIRPESGLLGVTTSGLSEHNEFQTSSSSSFEFEFELARNFLDMFKSLSVE